MNALACSDKTVAEGNPEGPMLSQAHNLSLAHPASPWLHAYPCSYCCVRLNLGVFSPVSRLHGSHFPHGCLVCRRCFLTDVLPPLTNNSSCSPSGRPVGPHPGAAKSSHNHSSVQSPLICDSRGTCHAGKPAVTDSSTSRHIICYFGPVV